MSLGCTPSGPLLPAPPSLLEAPPKLEKNTNSALKEITILSFS